MLAPPTQAAIATLKRTPLVCRHCHQEAIHNEKLRISFCAIHGLSAPLDQLNFADPRAHRASLYVRTVSPTMERGSWAVPAG